LTLVIAVLVAVLLVAVGTHAVMIVTAEALTRLTDSSDEEAFGDAGGAVVRDRVITESGRILGELKDVIVVGGPDRT
jgi:3-oxoacyl-[acyl-carrier-protein] synthase III